MTLNEKGDNLSSNHAKVAKKPKIVRYNDDKSALFYNERFYLSVPVRFFKRKNQWLANVDYQYGQFYPKTNQRVRT